MMTLLFVMAVGQTQPVEKEIRYKKETVVDLTGSEVRGEDQVPSTFFVTKMDGQKADSLLNDRLRFRLKGHNALGF